MFCLCFSHTSYPSVLKSPAQVKYCPAPPWLILDWSSFLFPNGFIATSGPKSTLSWGGEGNKGWGEFLTIFHKRQNFCKGQKWIYTNKAMWYRLSNSPWGCKCSYTCIIESWDAERWKWKALSRWCLPASTFYKRTYPVWTSPLGKHIFYTFTVHTGASLELGVGRVLGMMFRRFGKVLGIRSAQSGVGKPLREGALQATGLGWCLSPSRAISPGMSKILYLSTPVFASVKWHL